MALLATNRRSPNLPRGKAKCGARGSRCSDPGQIGTYAMLKVDGLHRLFEPLVAWQHEPRNALSPEQLASSVAHAGDGSRLRGVMQRLTTGQPVSVAIVGGSISAGATYTTLRGEKANWLWHRLFFDWMNMSFPHRANTHFNGALPASTPGYVESCITLHVPRAADLVFVEYAANFDNARAYERLLRRLLGYPRRPAVLLLNMPYFFGAGLPRNINPNMPIGGRDLNFSFHGTMSDETSITTLAQHYGVPSLSMRNALFHEVKANATAHQRLTDVMLDRVHPAVLGHQFAAALSVSFLRQQLLQMSATDQLVPPSTASLAQPSRAQLPPPMFPGNEDADRYVCVRGKELLPLVHSYGGWEYRVEGDRFSNPKPGLVATEPGKRLDLCWQPPPKWRRAAIKLGYLTSYEHMGRANYSCSGLCSCRVGVIDAYTKIKRSVHWVTSLSVAATQSQSPRQLRRESRGFLGRRRLADADSCCMLSISTMADPAGRDRHKFKVLSMYTSSRSAAGNAAWLHGKTIWNIEHGLEDGTFTDPEIPSHMRVEGKSTLLTARRGGGRRKKGTPKG